MQPTDPGRDPILAHFVERAAAQISVPPRDAPRPRRVMLLPLLGTGAVVLLVIASALGIGRAINEARSGVASLPSPTASATAPSGTAPGAQATPSASRPVHDPANLDPLPWEGAIVDALSAAGMPVQTIGASVEEGALGVLLPGRAFIVTPGPVSGGFGQGADVVLVKNAPFVKGAGGAVDAIRVCGAPDTLVARNTYVTYVDGQRVQSSDAVAPIYHLVSADYFVRAYDTRTADALIRALGVLPAHCPDRLSIGGHTYRLTADLWRDFMPVTPPGGRPLMASLMLASEDGSTFPASITADHVWVFNSSWVVTSSPSNPTPASSPAPSAVWDTGVIEARRSSPAGTAANAMEVVAFDGPKWDPGTRVSVILRLQVGGGQYLIDLHDVEIKSAS